MGPIKGRKIVVLTIKCKIIVIITCLYSIFDSNTFEQQQNEEMILKRNLNSATANLEVQKIATIRCSSGVNFCITRYRCGYPSYTTLNFSMDSMRNVSSLALRS